MFNKFWNVFYFISVKKKELFQNQHFPKRIDIKKNMCILFICIYKFTFPCFSKFNQLDDYYSITCKQFR